MQRTISPAVLSTLDTLPDSPGVYQMINSHDTIIYVGKAKNLKSRVSSYFKDSTKHTVAKYQMVTQVVRIEIIETTTEIEALVLETNLIKSLKPKYNILMKDDKNLSYIRIKSGPAEEVYRSRIKSSDDSESYGPYVSGTRISATLAALKRVFKVRACQVAFQEREGHIHITNTAGRSLPCLDYYIGLCPAPCTLEASKLETHRENVASLRQFLSGNKKDIFTKLEEEMIDYSNRQLYEKAKKTKDILDSLRSMTLSHQVVRDAIEGDYDVYICSERHSQILISILSFRSGEVRSLVHHEIENPLDESTDELLSLAIAEKIIENEGMKNILLHEPLSDESSELLRELGVKIEVPIIGAKRELVNFVRHNATEYLHRKALDLLSDTTLTRSHMETILGQLGYNAPQAKDRIIFECYDISHTDGRFTVASRSVLVNGKSDTSLYRKYQIKDIPDGKIDDFASMREVMRRRYIEGVKESNFPHLIIIDGGKGQLSAALEGIEKGREQIRGEWLSERHSDEEILNHLGVNPQICSLAKRLEEVFLPYQSESIRFDVASGELRVFQKIRDEAHRFAITFNRSKRTKEMKKNLLEEIPGIGPVTRKKLLTLAGSIDAIRNLREDQIDQIVSKSQKDALIGHGVWVGEEKG